MVYKVTLILCCFIVMCCTSEISRNKTARTLDTLVGLLFGSGIRCTGCPPHFCDDDPAIIYGYCCGCSQFYEYLPVRCSANIRCPLNGYELCERYEYMMQCCCGR